jgi:hypothetical protein
MINTSSWVPITTTLFCLKSERSKSRQHILYCRFLLRPCWTGEPECISNTGIWNVAHTRDRLELCEVDAASLCEHVFADVDVFDVREDECAAVFSRHGVRDIYGFVQLLGGDVMNELARALGSKWNYLALHAEGAFLDAGGFYLHLNTRSLTQVSREHAVVQHTHFPLLDR